MRRKLIISIQRNIIHIVRDWINIKSINQCFRSIINQNKITTIYFYGAGCSSEQRYVIEKALKVCFIEPTIIVERNMLATAKGLLGKKTSFPAILGAGEPIHVITIAMQSPKL